MKENSISTSEVPTNFCYFYNKQCHFNLTKEAIDNMSVISERDHALSILDLNLRKLSKLYRECYLSKGRGALSVYATIVIGAGLPSEIDYRTKEEILELFDAPGSRDDLAKLIDNYEPKKEGILVLITSYSNATFFVTFKLK